MVIQIIELCNFIIFFLGYAGKLRIFALSGKREKVTCRPNTDTGILPAPNGHKSRLASGFIISNTIMQWTIYYELIAHSVFIYIVQIVHSVFIWTMICYSLYSSYCLSWLLKLKHGSSWEEYVCTDHWQDTIMSKAWTMYVGILSDTGDSEFPLTWRV